MDDGTKEGDRLGNSVGIVDDTGDIVGTNDADSEDDVLDFDDDVLGVCSFATQ